MSAGLRLVGFMTRYMVGGVCLKGLELLVRITHPLREAPRPESQSRQGSLRAKPSYPSQWYFQQIYTKSTKSSPKHRKVSPESGVSSTSSRWHSKREPGGGGVSLGLSIGGSKIKELGQKLLIWCAAAMKCRPLHRNLHPSSWSLLSFDTKRISVACGTGCDDRDDLLYQEGGMSSSERRQHCLPSSHETPTRRPRITSPI